MANSIDPDQAQLSLLLSAWAITADTNTLQPLHNTVRYNTALDITRFKDGSQKCIDYIEK